jgi:hypothetical protein
LQPVGRNARAPGCDQARRIDLHTLIAPQIDPGIDPVGLKRYLHGAGFKARVFERAPFNLYALDLIRTEILDLALVAPVPCDVRVGAGCRGIARLDAHDETAANETQQRAVHGPPIA